MTTFIESNCTITHDGREFSAGGSWLCDCSDGYRRGVVYVTNEHELPHGWGQSRSWAALVTTWHGEHIAFASLGPIYCGNYCRMRSVSFDLNGVTYVGRYCPDTSQAVRVRSTKRVVDTRL